MPGVPVGGHDEPTTGRDRKAYEDVTNDQSSAGSNLALSAIESAAKEQ
jgi:hypothetical protein